MAGQRRRPATAPAATEHRRVLPHGKRRDHDTDDALAPPTVDPVEPAADEAEPADPAEDPDTPTERSPTRAERPYRSLLVPAMALVVSLALLAAVLLVTRNDPGERARSAAAATATARSTLEQILSYNHATMAQQVPASQALLTGSFRKEFGETMTKTIVPLAQKDKTVVRARAHEVGVMSQTDDTVTVQAFVNQARTSDTQEEPSIDQNRVIATLTKVDNRWLVSALKAY